MDYRSQLQTALGAAYRLERELGGGGMSRVFVAEETSLGRKVVVKVLPPELLAGVNVDRFNREIQLAAKLQQAQIVPVLAAGEVNGVPYYTMPFVEGESLRAKLDRVGALPIGEVVNILRDVTRALAYAHDHGVVHRDIKPDNVLLSGGTAVVTDFGIAKAISAARVSTNDTALTQMGTSVGTPAYISPEQAAGDPDIDHRADIYSLGCMAYELLTGQPPFHGRTPQRTLAAHLTEAPQPIEQLRPDVPPPLAAIVMQCLEKDPAARPQRADDISAALDGVSGSSAAMSPMLLAGPGAIRRALIAYAIAFAAVAILAKAAVVAIGVPDWVFTGAVILMVLGLPVIAATAYVHHTTRRIAVKTPVLTPGGSAAQHGMMANLALRARPHLSWRRAWRGGAIAIGGFAAVVVAVMVLRLFGIGPAASLLAAGRLEGRTRLLVVDFDAGKDTSLSHVVTEAVRTNLGQSKVVSIMPPAAIAAALQRMQKPATTRIDSPLAREIALRDGAKAIVAGSVTPLGQGYVVSLRLVAADSGNDLAAFQKTVDGTSQLLDAIDGLTRKLRGRIGESLKSVRDAPALDQVTTRSYEALRKYTDALRATDLEGDYARAASLLREAVALDTTFAMAYRKLGVALGNSGMPRPQIDSALTRAYQYRDRLSERERHLAVGTYFASGPGRDRVKAIEAFQQALSADTGDATAVSNLAGLYAARRDIARAESLWHAVAASGRASQGSFSNYARALMIRGKIQQAESVYAEMRKRFPTTLTAQVAPSMFLQMRGQYDSLEQFFRSRTNDANPIARINALGNLAASAQLRGRIREARALAAQAVALNVARGASSNPLGDSLSAASVAIWYLERPDQGVRALDAALAQIPLRKLPIEQRLGTYVAFANTYSLGGRPDKARALLAQFDADLTDPSYSAIAQPMRHAMLGEIAIAEKRPLDGIRELWKADSMPDGPVGDCGICMSAEIGRAYDLASLPDSAIAHWERFISDPFARISGAGQSYLPGMYKRLGELYEAKGDVQKAASNYLAFIDLWKNADAELQPKVMDAKKRLERLRGVSGR